jgi:hypothetical protein
MPEAPAAYHPGPDGLLRLVIEAATPNPAAAVRISAMALPKSILCCTSSGSSIPSSISVRVGVSPDRNSCGGCDLIQVAIRPDVRVVKGKDEQPEFGRVATVGRVEPRVD